MADSITAGGFIFPPFLDNANLSIPVSFTSYALGAVAGNGLAFVGRAFIADRSASKLLSSAGGAISFLTGASSVTATTAVHALGIQDVTTTPVTAPMEPDGTYDVSTTLTGSAGSQFTANSWITKTMTSGGKTISHGELYSIVWRVVSSASVGGLRIRTPMGVNQHGMSYALTLSITTVASTLLTGIPNAVMHFDDGTLGWLMGSTAFSSVSSQSISSGGTNNEYGMRFHLPWNSQIDQLITKVGALATAVSSADYTVLLYSDPKGTPVTVTAITVSPFQRPVTATDVTMSIPLQAPISITASTTYLLAVKSTSVQPITIQKYEVGAAANKIAFPAFGSLATGARAGGAGAFSMQETSIPAGFGVRVNQITAGGGTTTVTTTTTITITVGGAGGMLVHPGVTGGFRG